MRAARVPFALVGAMLLTVACAGRNGGGVEEPLELDTVSFRMAAGVNGDRPARVALVRVDDDRLAEELLGIETAAWFGGEDRAFRNAHPASVHDGWEVVPGHDAGPFDVEVDEDLVGVLFCDTRIDGPPLRLERDGDLVFDVSGEGCALRGGSRKESFFDRLRRRKRVDVTFALSPDANGSRPVRVELVRTPDTQLVTELARLDSQAWFSQAGREFRARHSDALFDDWELVPGATYGPFELGVNDKADGVLFCGTPAGRALRVKWQRNIEIEIDARSCRFRVERVADRTGRTWRWNPLTWGIWR